MNSKCFFFLISGFFAGYIFCDFSNDKELVHSSGVKITDGTLKDDSTVFDKVMAQEDMIGVEDPCSNLSISNEHKEDFCKLIYPEDSDYSWEAVDDIVSYENHVLELLTSLAREVDFQKKQEFLEIFDLISPEIQSESIRYLFEFDSIDNKILGIDILTRVGRAGEELIDLPFSILNSSNVDDRLIVKSIKSLDLSIAENRNYIELMEDYSNSDNVEIRSESLIAIGAKATNRDHLQSILSLTDDDASIAILALANSTVLSEDIKHKLLKYSFDETLPFGERYIAIKSLDRFLLTENEKERIDEILQRITTYH